jgi:CheY-like chemotaxis protein
VLWYWDAHEVDFALHLQRVRQRACDVINLVRQTVEDTCRDRGAIIRREHRKDPMARFLVAASPEPRAIVERILAGHELACAEAMAQAEQFLRERSFDLIICTLVFDESRMFDLLRLAKSRLEWQRIPFVCARVRGFIPRLPTALAAAALTCRALGAKAFLDIADYQVDPEREMRDAIERLVDTKSRRDN